MFCLFAFSSDMNKMANKETQLTVFKSKVVILKLQARVLGFGIFFPTNSFLFFFFFGYSFIGPLLISSEKSFCTYKQLK